MATNNFFKAIQEAASSSSSNASSGAANSAASSQTTSDSSSSSSKQSVGKIQSQNNALVNAIKGLASTKSSTSTSPSAKISGTPKSSPSSSSLISSPNYLSSSFSLTSKKQKADEAKRKMDQAFNNLGYAMDEWSEADARRQYESAKAEYEAAMREYEEEQNAPKYKSSSDLNGTQNALKPESATTKGKQTDKPVEYNDADFRQMDINDSWSPNWTNDENRAGINLDWLKNTAKAAATGVAAGLTGAQRVLFEAGQAGRTGANVEQLDETARQLARIIHDRRIAEQNGDTEDLKSYDYQIDFYNKQLKGLADALGPDVYQQTLDNYDIAFDEFDKNPEAEDAFKIFETANKDLELKPGESVQERATKATSEMSNQLQEESSIYTKMAKAAAGDNWLGNFATDITVNAIQMAGDAATNLVIPGWSLINMGLRTAGSAAQEAEAEGASIFQQLGYASVKGGIEMATEMMFDGLAGIYGKGEADEIVEEVIRKLGKGNDAANTALRMLFSGLGEAAEEGASGIADPFAKTIYKGIDAIDPRNLTKEDVSDLLYDMLVGFAMGEAGGALNIATGKNAESNAKIEVRNALQAELESQGVDKAKARDLAVILDKVRSGEDVTSKEINLLLTEDATKQLGADLAGIDLNADISGLDFRGKNNVDTQAQVDAVEAMNDRGERQQETAQPSTPTLEERRADIEKKIADARNSIDKASGRNLRPEVLTELQEHLQTLVKQLDEINQQIQAQSAPMAEGERNTAGEERAEQQAPVKSIEEQIRDLEDEKEMFLNTGVGEDIIRQIDDEIDSLKQQNAAPAQLGEGTPTDNRESIRRRIENGRKAIDDLRKTHAASPEQIAEIEQYVQNLVDQFNAINQQVKAQQAAEQQTNLEEPSNPLPIPRTVGERATTGEERAEAQAPNAPAANPLVTPQTIGERSVGGEERAESQAPEGLRPNPLVPQQTVGERSTAGETRAEEQAPEYTGRAETDIQADIDKTQKGIDEIDDALADINAEAAKQPSLQQAKEFLENNKQYIDLLKAEKDKAISELNAFLSEKKEAVRRRNEEIKARAASTREARGASKPQNPQPETHIDNRTEADISNTKVNAFQYDNPEVKPFFKQAAEILRRDLIHMASSMRNGRNGGTVFGAASSFLKSVVGRFKSTTEAIEACEQIIYDKGRENYADPKRIEEILDQMLVNGYVPIDTQSPSIKPSLEYQEIKGRLEGGTPPADARTRAIQNLLDADIEGDFTEEQAAAYVDKQYEETGYYDPLTKDGTENVFGGGEGNDTLTLDEIDAKDTAELEDKYGQKGEESEETAPEETESEPETTEETTEEAAEETSPEEETEQPAAEETGEEETTTEPEIQAEETEATEESGTETETETAPETTTTTATVETNEEGQPTSYKGYTIEETTVATEEGKPSTYTVYNPEGVEVTTFEATTPVEAVDIAQQTIDSYTNTRTETGVESEEGSEGVNTRQETENAAEGQNEEFNSKPDETTRTTEQIQQEIDTETETVEILKDADAPQEIIDRHEQRIAELESELETVSQQEQEAAIEAEIASLEEQLAGMGKGEGRTDIYRRLFDLRQQLDAIRERKNTTNNEETEANNGPWIPPVNQSGTGKQKASQTSTGSMRNTAQQNGAEQETLYYVTIPEQESLNNAMNRVSSNMVGEMNDLLGKEAWTGEDIDTAYTIYGKLKYDSVKNRDSTAADAWAKVVQQHGTRAGQALQAMSKWARTGTAIAAEADNAINDNPNLSEEQKQQIKNDIFQFATEFDSIEDGDIDAIKDLIKKQNAYRKTGTFSPGLYSWLLDKVDNYDWLKEYATRQMMSMTSDFTDTADLGQKLKTWQVNAQLSRLGTFFRNLGGNASFGAIDTMAQDFFGYAIDSLVSKLTGKKEVGWDKGWLSNKARQAATDAMVRSMLEVAGDVDMTGDTTRYGTTSNRTNKMSGDPFEQFMSRWEQLLGYSLTTSDRFFRGMTETSVAEGLEGLSQEEAETIASMMADYRLFQNQGVAAGMSKGIHDILNRLGFGGEVRDGKRVGGFGVGDLINPYPGVPANLAVKALEYSPFNIIKGGVEIVKLLSDAKAGKAVTGQQMTAVMDIARGMAGTPIIALFVALSKSGVFKNSDDEDDYDVQAENSAQGLSGVQWNLSATMRGFNGENVEWKNGDQLLKISWLEPMNAFMSIASLLSSTDTDADIATYAGKYVEGTVQSILDLPVMENIQNVVNTFKYSSGETILEKGAEAGAQFLGDTVSGMLPAPISQLARGTDEYVRDTKGDNKAETAYNALLNSIPGLRNTLPVKTDNFGNPRINEPSAYNRLMNSFVRPGSVNTFQETAVQDEVSRLYDLTGDVSLYPDRNGPKSLEFGDEKFDLTADEGRAYHELAGQTSEQYVKELLDSDYYNGLTDEQKAETVKEMYSIARDVAKAAYADGKDIVYDSNTQKLLKGVDKPGVNDDKTAIKPENLADYVSLSTQYKDALKSEDYETVDKILKDYKKLDKNTQAVVSEHFDTFKTLMKFNSYGVGSKDYYAFKEGTQQAKEQLDVSSDSSLVHLLGIANADMSEATRKKIIMNGDSNTISSGAKAAYTTLSKYGYKTADVYDFFNTALNCASKNGEKVDQKGNLKPDTVAYALSQMKGLTDQQRSEIYNEIKSQVSNYYNDWKNYSYTAEINYINGRSKYTYSKPKATTKKSTATTSTGNSLYDSLKRAAW